MGFEARQVQDKKTVQNILQLTDDSFQKTTG